MKKTEEKSETTITTNTCSYRPIYTYKIIHKIFMTHKVLQECHSDLPSQTQVQI